MAGLEALRVEGKMTWIEEERAWLAAPDDVLTAFSRGGFQECKRATTTSRRDLRPAGGVWQGVNVHTGSVASAVWVNRESRGAAVVFLAVDGTALETLAGGGPDRDPYRENAGEA